MDKEMNKRVISRMKQETFNNHKVYRLENKNLTIWVDPTEGMNIFRLRYKQEEVVRFDEERYKKGATYGIPILYPTPNRVEQGAFEFNGQIYGAQNHGVVRKQAFSDIEIEESDDGVTIKGVLAFEKGTVLYDNFPFESRLKIKITLTENTLIYHYEVENQDVKPLPYGFALHPFFSKNGQDVAIRVFAKQVMEMSEEKLPTGKLLEVGKTAYNLESQVNVNTLDLDHVYTGIHTMPMAQISYKDFIMKLHTSKEFSHVVVYTPDEPFFCIENQTCSTNAHNLYQKGYKHPSGLEIVEPMACKSGEIKWEFCEKR